KKFKAARAEYMRQWRAEDADHYNAWARRNRRLKAWQRRIGGGEWRQRKETAIWRSLTTPNTHRAGKSRKSPYGAITMCYRQNARTTPKPARVHCGCWRRGHWQGAMWRRPSGWKRGRRKVRSSGERRWGQ